MCGIVGILSYGKQNSERENITAMAGSISYRGPDNTGYFSAEHIELGHLRLSILDLSTSAHQPMISSDGNFIIVYNGEVYNFPEIRAELQNQGVTFKTTSDTEVILELYAKVGTETPAKLRGMFAFAIWDIRKEELFIARDRLGQKPLKFYNDEHRFIFASELKAILKHPQVPREIDYTAIDQYLSLKYVPAPRTGFIGIYKLEPAHWLTIRKDGLIHKERYWQLNYEPKSKHNKKYWEEIVENKLKEAIQIMLVSDVPIGAHLSGGIDSSLIVALMSEMSPQPINTYSIGFAEKDYDELPYAKLVADKYHTKHHTYLVNPDIQEIMNDVVYHYEEPYADASAIPSWYLARETGRDITVVLNGDGGDENFAGYDRYKAVRLHIFLKFIPYKKHLSSLTHKLFGITQKNIFWYLTRLLKSYHPHRVQFFNNLIKYISDEEKELLYTDEFKNKINFNKTKETIIKKSNLNWLDYLLSIGIETHLPDDLLVKVDIASMAHSLEARSPMLDHEFVELTAKLPTKYKLHHNKSKYLLREIAYKYLPKDCIDRKKQGFTLPLKHWFRHELYKYMEDKLLDGNLKKLGLNEDRIKLLLKDHKNNTSDNSNEIWSLLMLHEWLAVWELNK